MRDTELTKPIQDTITKEKRETNQNAQSCSRSRSMVSTSKSDVQSNNSRRKSDLSSEKLVIPEPKDKESTPEKTEYSWLKDTFLTSECYE